MLHVDLVGVVRREGLSDRRRDKKTSRCDEEENDKDAVSSGPSRHDDKVQARKGSDDGDDGASHDRGHVGRD